MQSGIDERALIRRMTEGDQMAFELLFYRYRGKVYNFAKGMLPYLADAEEIVLEAFTRIWIGRERIDPEKPFGPYVFRAVRNLIIDRLRSRVNRMVCLKDEYFADNAGSDNPALAVEERQLNEWFDRTLEQLPEQRRHIFTLSRLEGLSYKEIAARLGISENTVDTQLRRALLFFRREFNKLKILLFF